MNVCFVTYGHVSACRGGIDRVTSLLAQIMRKKGHTVDLVSVCPPIKGDLLAEHQYVLPCASIEGEENIVFLRDFIQRNKVDILINQSERCAILNLVAQASCGCPVISVVHEDPRSPIKAIIDAWDFWKSQHGFTGFLCRFPYFLLRRGYQYYSRRKWIRQKFADLCRWSDAVVLLSEEFIPIFYKLVQPSHPFELCAIPNPRQERRNDTGNKEKLVLFVGRLEYSPKRLDRLIRIWAGIKDRWGWKLCVLGDGNYRSDYENLCADYHLTDVFFEGTVDPEPYYERASILCVTSTCEGQGLVISEAQGYGVIPIVFDSYESVHDLITSEQNGFLIKPFSENDYRNTLRRVMLDDEYRKEMHHRLSASYNHHLDLNHIADKWENLFARLCGNRD